MKAVGRPTKAPGGQVITDASREPTGDNNRPVRRPLENEIHLLLRVDEAARLLGIGTTLAYELVGRGVLPHVRLGRAVRVPRAALESWIATNTRGAPGTQAGQGNSREFTP
jgi:excisionase family DNA binding protein